MSTLVAEPTELERAQNVDRLTSVLNPLLQQALAADRPAQRMYAQWT